MNEFDLVKFKKGCPAETRNGIKAEFVAFVDDAMPSERLIWKYYCEKNKANTVKATYQNGRIRMTEDNELDLVTMWQEPKKLVSYVIFKMRDGEYKMILLEIFEKDERFRGVEVVRLVDCEELP